MTDEEERELAKAEAEDARNILQLIRGQGEDALEMDRLRRENEKLKDCLLDLLRAPFNGMSKWAATEACFRLDHPGPRSWDPGPCICGTRKS